MCSGADPQIGRRNEFRVMLAGSERQLARMQWSLGSGLGSGAATFPMALLEKSVIHHGGSLLDAENSPWDSQF